MTTKSPRMKLLQKLLLIILAMLSLVWGVRAQVNLTNGLVAYYPFTGNATDASGNNNNGTLSGSATIVADQWGNANSACNMSGPNNPGRVTIPNSATLQFSTRATFSFWFRLNSNVGTNGFGNIVAGGMHCLFTKDGDQGGGLFCLTALNGSNLTLMFGNVNMTQLNYVYPNYTTGTWLHCVYVMDTTEQRLYINSSLVASLAGAPYFGTMNTRQLCLGRFGSNWYPVDGALDEFRVYNRVLNTQEIEALTSNTTVPVSISNISPSSVCAGSSVSVGITAPSGLSAGNTFTIELSDPTGSFAVPVTIGTLVSNATSATVSCTIPPGTPSGTGYRLRVLTSSPLSIGAAAATSVTVNGVLGDIPNPSLFHYLGNLNGSDYYYCATAQTWTNAQATCTANGGNLATIPDAATNDFLRSHLTGGYAVGFTDQVTEGTFLWADGSPNTYTNWNTGEPNNSGNEDFTQVNAATGTWNDVNTVATAPFILQLNAPVSNGGSVCSGGTITLFAASLTGATYQWNGPNGFSSAQQNPVISNATISMAGTYTVTITKGGCSASVTTTVQVNQAPNGMSATSTLLPSLSNGLVLYYPLDGNANDLSGNSLNGTNFGMTTVADRFGNPGGAMKGNGSNAYISAPAGVYFTGGDFTVSCWVKTGTYTSWGRIMDFGGGQAFNNVLLSYSYGTTGRPASELFTGVTSGGQCVSPTAQTALNQWALITYVYTAGTGKIYLNGTQVASAVQGAPLNVVRTLCYIGRSNWPGDPYPNASFDDFRIYNRALSQTEIRSLLLEQNEAISLVAAPAAICPNTASLIRVTGSQFGVSYQLQNATTSANIGAAQYGNGDTLSFPTGNLAANTNFQVLATALGGCSVVISPVTVSVITPAGAPVTTGDTRCGPGSVTLSASGAPNGAVYYWYTSPTGGSPVFIGPNFTTAVNATTTWYVSIYANGCESNRTPVTATINLATSPAVNLYAGLIMHYKMDGNTADSSGRGNNGTLVSSGSYVNDRLSQPNSALSVSGNNYIDCGTPADIQQLTNQVSVSMWINCNYFAGGNMPLLNDWAGTGIYSGLYGYWDANGNQQNRVRWRIDGNAYMDSYVNVPFGQWTLITCTYDGSALRTYQDGQLTGVYNYSAGIGYTGTPTQIGRQANGSGSQIFGGTYDDIRVYSRALNADEVMTLYFNESVAFSNTPLCEGSSLQLSSPAITGAVYSWTGPNGFTSSQQNPAAIPNVTSAQAGTYSLVITNPNGCVSAPQLNTVVVNPLPAAPATANDTVCANGNATLTASGGSSYLWYTTSTGGSPISGQTGSTYTINNLTATDTLYVSAVSAAGCESPLRAPVIAYYANPIQAGLAVNGSAVCANSIATITVSNSQPGVSYQAFFSSNAVSAPVTGNGGTITLNVNTALFAAGPNSVTIVATQPSCGSLNLTNTATITIHALPAAVITASGPTTFCMGGDVTLSAPASLSYSWSTGAVSQSILVSQAGAYSVTVTDTNGCSNASSSVNVSVVAPPAAAITAGGPTTFCQGDNVLLTAGGGSSYTWSEGSTGSSLSVSQPGVYYVIASNGYCSDTSSAITVNVNPLPNVIFSMGADTFFCVNSPVYALTPGTPAGGTFSGPGVSGSQFDPATAGTGYVPLSYSFTDSLGCTATATAYVYVDVCTGLADGSANGVLSAVPNPTNGSTKLSWPESSQIRKVEVYDATARLVLSEDVSGRTQTELSLAGLTAGIYQVRLTGTEVLFLRIVKE